MLERLAGTDGMVKANDPSDGTMQVRFPWMLAWLPTDAVTEVSDLDMSGVLVPGVRPAPVRLLRESKASSRASEDPAPK